MGKAKHANSVFYWASYKKEVSWNSPKMLLSPLVLLKIIGISRQKVGSV
jgi:hypothetical protein